MSQRRAGVLLHPTSLPPTKEAPLIGDLGKGAFEFVDWLAAAGFKAWQMLPIGPVGAGNSPYCSTSSFAIEPMLLAIEDLEATPSATVDWDLVRKVKGKRLGEMFASFDLARDEAFESFASANTHWLQDYCEWVGGDPLFHAFVQFVLDGQWKALKAHATQRGISLIGDLPIFVGADSADVATRPDLFRLNDDGAPTVVTGVPPDEFAKDGQLWGHPHYDWPVHRKEHFAWWRNRVHTALERFDQLRIDHFIGFTRVYEVDAAHTNARDGTWKPTPGGELFTALESSLGPLPFIAEDLGTVTDEVTELRKAFGLPGMEVLQWSVLAETLPSTPRDAVVYPGTHDNDTIGGWWDGLNLKERTQAGERLGPDPIAGMVEMAFKSPADTAIVQAQDLLGLGSDARMNRPGIATGNWQWRLGPGELNAAVASRCRSQLRDSRPSSQA